MIDGRNLNDQMLLKVLPGFLLRRIRNSRQSMAQPLFQQPSSDVIEIFFDIIQPAKRELALGWPVN
jgi:hypothetical protein